MLADDVASEALLDSIVSHGAGSILAGTVFDTPFPHLIFEKFFPEDIYRRLIELWCGLA